MIQKISQLVNQQALNQAEEEVSNTPTQRPYSWTAEILKLPKEFQDKGFKNYNPRNEWEENMKKVLINYAKNEKEKSLALLGKYGTGKTHLAIAVMKNQPPVMREIQTMTSIFRGETNQNIAKIWERSTCTFLVLDEFFQELNDCVIDHRSKLNVIESYLNTNDIICLDDLRTENFTPAKKENLYLFVNRAYLNKKRIIITSNFTLDELEKEEPRVASRLSEMCDKWLFVFKGDDYRKNKR